MLLSPKIDSVYELNSSLGGMKFGKDGDGNYGYYGADGSLIPFKSAPPYIKSVNLGITYHQSFILRNYNSTIVVCPNGCATFALHKISYLFNGAYGKQVPIESVENGFFSYDSDENYIITPTDNSSDVTIHLKVVETSLFADKTGTGQLVTILSYT